MDPHGGAMLADASAIIRRYTGQDLEETAGRQEEHAGGMGRYQIQLTQVPVTAVSAITEDAVAFTEFRGRGGARSTDGVDDVG